MAPSSSLSQQEILVHNLSSTWIERLLMTLMSYFMLVLLPIACIVLGTRHKLLPECLQNSNLIQWFVYGEVVTSCTKDADTETLLSNESKRGQPTDRRSKDVVVFCWCFTGLLFSYLSWGLLQEKIMTTRYEVTSKRFKPEFESDLKNALHPNQNSTLPAQPPTVTFHDSQFLVFINRLTAFILSIMALVYNRPKISPKHFDTGKKPQAPLYEYVYCSVSNILSSWCQLEALKYVNFPTQVLSKSFKIVPVMLMSRLILNKKYPATDYLCALALASGMFIFIYNQSKGEHQEPQNDGHVTRNLVNNALANGMVILGLYHLFDSFTSNWQSSMFTRYGISNWQMMAATNFYSLLLTLTSLTQLGSLKPALELLFSSKPLLFDCICMSLMSCIGQFFVYYTIKKFGSVIFAAIMTLRQFFAIVLSCAIYGHRLTMESSVGFVIVFTVVGFQVWRRSKLKSPAKIEVRKATDWMKLRLISPRSY